HTLKFADRQKMLTQKMLKEKFLVFTKENAERNNVRLRGSIILFKNGLEGLIDGDNKRGLAKVTSKPIQAKLKEMHVLYTESEDLYKKPSVSFDEIKSLAVIDKKLLALSIEVVSMIENTLVY
nr:type IV pili methyl-accepting chemotaxis transducer N-terminal domain-containing protein [Campylobacterota bacterium]